MAEDPVCGGEVDEKTWLESGADKTVYKGQTYYFCGLICRQKFLGNPDKYIGTEEREEQGS